MIQKISLLLVSLILLSVGCNQTTEMVESPTVKQENITKVILGKKSVKVEVMNDDAERAQGLSGRESLADGTGLLFDFTNTRNRLPGFWMKDMLFNIDIIWIKDHRVIAINRNVPKPEFGTLLAELPNYYPPSEIDYVLEVPAGFSEKNKIEIGEKIIFE